MVFITIEQVRNKDEDI